MTKLDKAALEHAQSNSTAPDKETPDWVMTDFKAGAKWLLSQLDFDDLEDEFWEVMGDGDFASGFQRAKACTQRLKDKIESIIK